MASSRRQGSDDTATIALFEPLRLIRVACARWPTLDASPLTAALPAGAADDADLDRQVPLRAVFDILAQMARSVSDPALPLVLAQGTRIDEMGVPGFAIMTAPTAREALARAVRFQRLICAAGAWELREDGDRAVLRWQRALPLDLGHRLANEIVLAQLVAYARDLLGAFVPHAVRLRHSAPASCAAHRAFFGCPVHFGEVHDEVELPSALLMRAPRTANPAMARYFERVADAHGAALAAPPSFVSEVQKLMLRALPDGDPTPRVLARQLGVSVRTLQARLGEEGATFRGLLDALRRERALQMLEQGETVTGVAFALGFSETSAFSRAFRRWYGRAPRDVLRGESSRLRAGSSG